MSQGRYKKPLRKFTPPAGGFGPQPLSCQGRGITNAGDKSGPFSFEFMTPEEKDHYGEGTEFIRVPNDPTEESKEFIVEQVVIFFVRYDPEKDETFLLERRIWAD